MSYLCYLCLLALNGVKHISCCVFVLFSFVLSPVSLDSPFCGSSVSQNTVIFIDMVVKNRNKYKTPKFTKML
jgi:hypothetical protein